MICLSLYRAVAKIACVWGSLAGLDIIALTTAVHARSTTTTSCVRVRLKKRLARGSSFIPFRARWDAAVAKLQATEVVVRARLTVQYESDPGIARRRPYR